MSTFEVATATLSQLLAYFNEHSGKPPVKKFADRKTAERRVLQLMTSGPAKQVPAPNPAPEPVIEAGETKEEVATMATAPKKAPKAKKKTAAKKAPKANGAPADRSKAVADTWKDKKVAAARATHNNVKVGGETYRSVLAAFKALKLPESKHIPFRGKLKAAGKLAFEKDNGEKVMFTVVAKGE